MTPRSLALVGWAVVLALAPRCSVGMGWLASVAPRAVAAGPLAAPDNALVLQPFLSGLSSPVPITNAGARLEHR